MNIPKVKKIIRRTALGLLLTVVALVVLLPLSLYVPVVQDWVCQAVVGVLNQTSDDLEYEVGAVRLHFPLRLEVRQVAVHHRPDSTLLLRVGSIETALDDLSLRDNHYRINALRVKDVAVSMDTLTASLGLAGSLGSLYAGGIDLRLDSASLALAEAVIDQPDLHVWMGPAVPDSTESEPWRVDVARFALRGGRVRLDMSDESLAAARHGADSLAPYLDYQHLSLVGLEAEAEHIAYHPDRIAAQLNVLQAADERSGLGLRQLGASLLLRGDHLVVDDLDLALTEQDYLRGRLMCDLTLADETPSGQLDVSLTAALDSANIMRLAAPYVPQLADGWVCGQQSRLALEARLTADSLDLRHLQLSIPGLLDVQAEGQGIYVLDSLERRANVRLRGQLQHVEPLLTALVGAPESRPYRVPDSLDIDLQAAQQRARMSARLALRRLGRPVVRAEATYDVETEAYHVDAATFRLNAADFVPDLVADRMSLRVLADGRHFNPDRRNTRLEASFQVDSLYYQAEDGRRDSLNGLSGQASLVDGNYRAQFGSLHPTLRLDALVEGRYRRDTVSAEGYLRVDRADMARLPYLSAQPELGALTLSTRFEVGYDWADNARMRVCIDTLGYDEGTLHQHFGDIHLNLDSHRDWLVADVTGGDALLGVRTGYSVAQLPAVADSLLAELDRQMSSLRPDFAALCERLPDLDVEMRLARQNPFSQALEYQTGITFDRLQLNLRNDRYLTLTGEVHNLLDADGGLSLDTVTVEVQPSRMMRTYDYRVHALHHNLRESASYDVHAHGQLMPDSVTAGLWYVNGRQKTVYDLLASVHLGDDTLRVHLEKGPTLYEQEFAVNPDNYISLMHYRDLQHSKPTTRARLMLEGPRDLKLSLYTRQMPDSEVGNQLLMLVRNLDLGYATGLMEWDGGAAGQLNMMTAIDLFPDSIYAWSRTGIHHLGLGEYRADTMAVNVTAIAAHDRRDVFGTLALDSVVKVRFDAELADSADIRARINRLPLPMLSAFLPSNMKLWGTASGSVTLRGRDLDHAALDGGLSMNDAGLVYTDLNARLSFPNDTLRFARNRLLIPDYHILAANQNPITVRGLVDMSKDMSNPMISLTVKGDNVRIINSKKTELRDQYICGRLPISPDIKVKGTLAKMDVTGRLSVLSGTNLSYYMQDDPLESSSRVDQLVEFVRFDHVDRLLSSNRRRRQQAQTLADEGVNVELRIDIANDAKVTAYLAGPDNNKAEMVGGAGMTLQCLPDGRMIMNGTYDVNSGVVDYKLPILPMAKTFNITSDSELTWRDCDPTNPAINLTATEEVRTTVNDETGSRVVKFLVTINIKGTLDALNLTFDCSAPDDGAISSDIATLDADERSKTALMLLIAQTYIGPGNSSSMGLGTANAALNSMLNREMDSMLSGMKHTNIDLGIDTYNTDGGNTRTDYSVKVSQNFFNDRFRATIGGQVSSGGDAGQRSGARLGDMSLEWLIKKDGSHLMKLYRSTNYESVLEGELIETGISYVQERSGFRLRQLFIPTSRKRQQLIQQMLRDLQEKDQNADAPILTDSIPTQENTAQPHDENTAE